MSTTASRLRIAGPSARIARRYAAALSLLCISYAAGAVDVDTTTPLDPQPVPGEVAVESLWTDRVQTLGSDQIGEAWTFYGSFDALEDEPTRAAYCTEQAEALAGHLRAFAQSLAFWSMELECASLGGDTAREERATGALRALFEHELREASWPALDYRPIRVTSEHDVLAWIELSGLELIALYYPMPSHRGELRMRAELWSEEEGRETIHDFDFIEPMARQLGGADAASNTLNRLGLVNAMFQRYQHEPESSIGELAIALSSLRELKDRAAVIATLDRHASTNNLSALRMLADLCVVERQPECAPQAIDHLLPLAEQGSAVHLTYLAYAHAFGVGTRKDLKAAAQLMDRAAERLGPHSAGLLFRHLLLRSGTQRVDRLRDVPKFLPALFERAVREGEARAFADWLSVRKMAGQRLSRQDEARLRQSAEAGDAIAAIAAAVLLESRDADRLRWWMLAAPKVPAAALDAARLLAQDPNADIELLIRHYELALVELDRKALGEFIEALYRRDQSTLALNWVRVAATLGDAAAQFTLARAILAARDGSEGSPAQAKHLLERVVQQAQGPRLQAGARRALARLLVDGAEGVEPDLGTAFELLRSNVQKLEDPESALLLAVLLILHPDQATADENGERQLRAMADAQRGDAQYELANLLLSGDLPGGTAEALQWFDRAQSNGHLAAQNDLAWLRCTDADPEIRNPALGLPLAEALHPRATGRAAYLDTVAACHAANRQFPQAVEIQQAALDALPESASAEARAGFEARLADYQAGKAYLAPPRE